MGVGLDTRTRRLFAYQQLMWLLAMNEQLAFSIDNRNGNFRLYYLLQQHHFRGFYFRGSTRGCQRN